MKKLTIVLLTVLTILVSCKKDKDRTPAPKSRTLSYEVTGNFTGTFFISYTTASGGTTNDQITALPWKKEITYADNVTAAVIALTGNGGTAGQKVTLVIKRAGTQVGTPIEVVANSFGAFSEGAPVIVF